MIIDPAGPDDPREHVGFEQNVPMPLTDRGEKTIEAAALDRLHLNGHRLHHYQRVLRLTQLIAIGEQAHRADWKQLGEDAAVEIEELKKPTAPFSAMTLAMLGL